MPRKKETADILVASGGQEEKQQRPPQLPSLPDFYHHMISFPDRIQAMTMAREHATLEFNQTNDGSALEECLVFQRQYDEAFHHSERVLDEFKKAVDRTPKHIKQSVLNAKKFQTLNSDKEQSASENPADKTPDHTPKNTPFHHWRGMDQLSSALLTISALVTAYISWANVYANLMASGEMVFLEQPWLAGCIAALAPCAAMSFKLFAQFFEFASTKKKYVFLIYALTLLVTIAWTIAFSTTFTGAGSDLDLDALLEGDGGKGALLVWLQLVCEILVSASLFLALEDITLKYAPNTPTQNPEWISRKRALDDHRKTHGELNKTRSHNHKKIVKLESAKKLFIHQRLAAFGALRKRSQPPHAY